MLAHAGWTVLPVGLAGTAEAWPVGRPLWRPFRTVRVTFGDAIETRDTRELAAELLAFWERHGRLDQPQEGPS